MTDNAPAPTTAPRNRGLLIALIAVSSVVVLAAAALTIYLVARPGQFNTTGTMSLLGEDSYMEGAGPNKCVGSGGYDDIAAGTQVVVKDQGGSTVAVSTLGAGRPSTTGCDFTFTLENVPGGAKFYEVEVGRRGGLQYTESELRDGIGVSLG